MNTKFIHNKTDSIITVTIYISDSIQDEIESQETHTFQLSPGAHRKLVFG